MDLTHLYCYVDDFVKNNISLVAKKIPELIKEVTSQ